MNNKIDTMITDAIVNSRLISTVKKEKKLLRSGLWKVQNFWVILAAYDYLILNKIIGHLFGTKYDSNQHFDWILVES